MGKKSEEKSRFLQHGGIFDKEDMCHALALGQTECRWEPALLPQRNVMRPKLITRLKYRTQKEGYLYHKSPVGMPARAHQKSVLEQVGKNT